MLALAAGSSFLGFWLVSTFLSFIVFPLFRVLFRREPAGKRQARCRVCISLGFEMLVHWMRWVGLVDFHSGRARKELRLTPPFVLICNHPTLIDVVLTMAVHRDICVIAKPMLFKNFICGRLLRDAGHIEAPDGEASAMAGAAVIETAVERLQAGVPVLIFPEGTRSPPGGLGPWSKGAFEMATRANVPIVPVFLSCDPPTLCRGMPWYALPKVKVRYRMTILEAQPIEAGVRAREAAARYQSQFVRIVEEGATAC
jgi:1-acyl-sn-glycerol-3-phosphate acyltransferase